MKTANEIRSEFIDFFVKEHGHKAVRSSSVVPLDDPTLLFTNAGMNQFKDVFLGTGTRPYLRAVDTQKCIRAGGKHNDLEDVGRDTYHHTFFEMLGNWSFGDYYKREAIQWAWELLTNEWGLDRARLHATVFAGDSEYGLEPDDEAASLWTEVTDIDPAHVHRFGKKDNFWMMGDTGPCGPCSEIHIDRTPDRSGSKLVNKGDAHVMEIWNLVFIQYNRNESGELMLLPAKHVDTGMGFERITAVLQGKKSNYDTDLFSPLMEAIGELVGKKYGGRLDDPTDVAFRVIADHLRMLTFAVTDGALPDNKGRGSVLRSVLRRGARFGWQYFGQRAPFMYRLVPALVEHMGAVFPELKKNPGRVVEVIKDEEADFLRTIERGLSLYADAAERASKQGRRISGRDVFDLHTTYGFPPDLTRQMATEAALEVDVSSYEQLMHEHEEQSRAEKADGHVTLDVTGGLPRTDDRAKWSGHAGEATVFGWIAENQFHGSGRLPGAEVGLLLDQTCFYAEQGGQVGDRGTMRTSTGIFEVVKTVKIGNAVVHVGHVSEGLFEVGQKARLAVSAEREFTRKNHTATHLLHWALHKVLGEHVEQRGSKVKPDAFTFDFAHTGPMTEEEKAEVERLVNEKVYADLPVRCRELPIAEAKQLPGVKAFFGDTYADVVRVVEIGGGFSREFCGGTHLEHTGQIGLFRVIAEVAVAKGIRRITCFTAGEAVKLTQNEHAILANLCRRLRCRPEESLSRFVELQEQNKRLQQHLKRAVAAELRMTFDKSLSSSVEIDGVRILVGELPSGAVQALRDKIESLQETGASFIAAFGWRQEMKLGMLVAVSKDLAASGIHADALLARLAKAVNGTGGGRATLAQGTGTNYSMLAIALDDLRHYAATVLAAARRPAAGAAQ